MQGSEALRHDQSGDFGNHTIVYILSFGPNNYISQSQTAPNSNHQDHHDFNLIFTFMVTLLLNLLQLKYQGDYYISPFQSKFLTIFFSILWLVLYYCCAYAACKIASKSRQIYKQMMRVFGAMALSSLGSLLFPDSVQHAALYALYAMVVVGVVVRRYCAGYCSGFIKRAGTYFVTNTRNLFPRDTSIIQL
ncbi:unnamed protein product [Amaranthus hypochondriacus]